MLSAIKQTIAGTIAYNDYEKEILEHDGDSNLVKAHSKMLTVDFKGSPLLVRTAIVPHQNARILGDIVHELPLFVFIHGLGGQLNQFEYILDTASFTANCLALDLPGHGKSEYRDDWDLYTTTSFVEICQQVLRDPLVPKHRGIYLLGHSMGSIIGLRLAQVLGKECVALNAITPPYSSPEETAKLANKKKWLYWVPPLLFDVFRSAVRIGGIESKSVKSLVSEACKEEKILARQLRVNLQSHTKVWLRTAYGLELLSETDFSDVNLPTLVIGASDDKVCPHSKKFAAAIPTSEYQLVHHAGHAVLIEKPHVVGAVCSEFARKQNQRLCLTWQLEHIASKSDKWSLKNEQKWKDTQSTGTRVSGFIGMKTLRQNDLNHCPAMLEKTHPEITAVVDISREKPCYDPSTFQSIEYHKFPTIAKHPPSREEVSKFIELVDSIRASNSDAVVAVHCHYGFNRTGFLICSYLIERDGYTVDQALEGYRESRPSGVHHAHFIDELHLRYNR